MNASPAPTTSVPSRRFCGHRLVVATALLALAPAVAGAAAPADGWKTNAAATAKVAFDDNVFLQESGPLANRSSFITTFQPQLGATFTRGTAWKAALTYAPEIAVYHSESGEDFVAHRVTHSASGRAGRFAWDEAGTIVLNHGPDASVVYAGVGGAPAIGGFSTRDRRDAFVVRNTFKGAVTFDRWLVRAVGGLYYHDFQSEKSTAAGYQNHADRADYSLGAEVGRRLDDQLAVFFGARAGRWTHERLFDTGAAYDNDYVRVLASLEGSLRPDLKVTAVAGPGWHDFGPHTVAGFRERSHWFADLAATWTPAKSEQVTFSLKRYLQPSGSGRAISRDTIADVAWKHTFSPRFEATLGLRAYRCDFEAPVVRDDLIVTPSVRFAWTVNPQWSVEALATWDDADSRVPAMPAREFDRAIFSCSLRRKFW